MGDVTKEPHFSPVSESCMQSKASQEADVRFHMDTQHWQPASHKIRARKCSSLEGPHL